MNFPILERLRAAHEVRVVSFNNGSSAFFKAFHPDTIGVNSKKELLSLARATATESVYVCYPTWRKELAASLLTRAPIKYIGRAPDFFWARGLWRFTIQGDPAVHHLENNLRLLEHVPQVNPSFSNLAEGLGVSVSAEGRVLGIHPTASSPAKYYPLEFWTELLTLCAPEFAEIKIFCGKNPVEVKFCENIRSGIPDLKVSLHIGLDFKTLTEALAHTSFFIGSDSALMHLTALLGKRVLGLWSFANFRVIYPYGKNVQVMLPEETLKARSHEYPDATPAYMQRANAQRAFEILKGAAQPNFTLQPRFVQPVRFYTF